MYYWFIYFQWVIWFSALAWSTSKCEPPVSSYLPPSTGGNGRPAPQYGPPGLGNGSPGGPGGRNGSGRQGNRNQISDSYSPPSQFSPSSNLDAEYGPPAQGAGRSGAGPAQGDFGGNPSQSGFGGSQSQGGFGGRSSQGALGASASQGGFGSQQQKTQGNGNTPNSEYGVPEQNEDTFGRSRSQASAGAGDRFGSGGRPQTSYGPPNQQSGLGRSPSDNNGGGGRGGQNPRQRPDSSYGPPPSGRLQQPNSQFGADGQSPGQFSASQRAPESSYGAPNVNSPQGGFGRQNTNGSPSTMYGAPGFGSRSGGGGSDYDGSESDVSTLKMFFVLDISHIFK